MEGGDLGVGGGYSSCNAHGSATLDGVKLLHTCTPPSFSTCMHMWKCIHALCTHMHMHTHNECTLLLGDHQVSWEQSCPWLRSTNVPPWFVLLVQSCPSLLQQYIHLGMASLGLWVRVLQCIDWLCCIFHSVASKKCEYNNGNSSVCNLYMDSMKAIANLLSSHKHKLFVWQQSCKAWFNDICLTFC